jgi:hypothetical protein
MAAAAAANASAVGMTLGVPGFGFEVFCELESDMKCIRNK